MQNRINRSNVDTGVTFVKFLWEECKPELESFDQNDIDEMCRVIFKKTDRIEILQHLPGNEKEKKEAIEYLKTQKELEAANEYLKTQKESEVSPGNKKETETAKKWVKPEK